MNAPTSPSCAGKVFLLGEYAVLGDLPSVVVTVAPRFNLALSQDESEPWHPQSPAGRLAQWARSKGAPTLSMKFDDPLKGTGGFGASTAQFALQYALLARELGWPRDAPSVWRLYRELMNDEVIGPSGADLLAQWVGGVPLVDVESGTCEELWPALDWSRLLVFSAAMQAGRKVATHEHLPQLARTGFNTPRGRLFELLEPSLYAGIAAIRAGDAAKVAAAMTAYSEVLSNAGLEIPATREDRLALNALPSVLATKGAGALQADVILVLLDSAPGSAPRNEVIRTARARGLTLIADGVTRQNGIFE